MDNNKIFGLWPVLEALKAGKSFEKILIREGRSSDSLYQIIDSAKKKNITLDRVLADRLDRLTKNANHQGVVAFLSSVEYSDLERTLESVLLSGKAPRLLLLDKITDVRNFGAIARSAECAGMDAIVVPAKNAAPLNIDAMKTSAGALNYIPVCRVPNLRTAIFMLKNYNIRIVAATEKADKSCFDADLSGAVAIVLGSEESGISENVMALSDDAVKIPVLGNIDSLNVSAAAAVIAFECVRQQQSKV
jgi:23S rRNA (guanosine2251-2'-O)-methyltransferase